MSLVGCPRFLIQYDRTYPLYVEAVSYSRNLRTCHNLVTGPTYCGLFHKFTKRAGLVLRSQRTKARINLFVFHQIFTISNLGAVLTVGTMETQYMI